MKSVENSVGKNSKTQKNKKKRESVLSTKRSNPLKSSKTKKSLV